ncbi:hypothetical protein [Rhizobium tumorigenes]|uniref:hypothetical protein n=1 Tax=Rhizobium tumorigenes TaxID=2041385 RepID=UPI00241CF0C0|nr:hypothetical protein [Rhizobium tumorigenes]WFS02786.1 hypothetical protein PR016_09365 [Rhizobium tumorigenes]
MSSINVQFEGDGIKRFTALSRQLGDGTAARIYSRAINDTGKVAATATGRALAKQTGLSGRTGAKAVKKQDRASASNLTFAINLTGGQIRVKYFKPRETASGVSAAPRNNRQVFVGSFMRAGFWPDRVDKPGWNRQIFYLSGKKFSVAKTDVYIPVEAVTGDTAQTFDQSKDKLDTRVTHYLKRLERGALS